MAMDCYQMFMKKGGIYTSIETVAHGCNLKLLYECIPIAFLIEAAGGVATNGTECILKQKIQGLTQKTQFIAGSKKEADFVTKTLACDGTNVPDLESSVRTRRLSLGYIMENEDERVDED
jgi:fructose-1,6-bisphosphatase